MSFVFYKMLKRFRAIFLAILLAIIPSSAFGQDLQCSNDMPKIMDSLYKDGYRLVLKGASNEVNILVMVNPFDMTAILLSWNTKTKTLCFLGNMHSLEFFGSKKDPIL